MLIKLTITTIILALLLLIALPCWSNDSLSADGLSDHDFRTRLHQIHNNQISADDISAEIQFGREVAARILAVEKLNNAARWSRYINLIGKYLAYHSSRNELEFYFAVLDSDAINAYAAPGGYIFITRGAIELAQDEAELAAILAHEIAHINARHIVNALHIRANENDNFTAFARVFSASADTATVAFNQAVDKALELLLQQGYEINDELEADKIAALLLAHSGYDPSALRRYLQRANEADTADKVSATHPTSVERFRHLDELIAAEDLNNFLQATPHATRVSRFHQYINQRN